MAHLREILLFLVIAGLLVPALQRLRISPILGFLCIGLIVGPHGLARFTEDLPWLADFLMTDIEGVRQISEIGVIFLLFMIGLELSLSRLYAMRHLVFGLGSLQIAVCATVIAIIAFTFGNSLKASIVLGTCLALSSTAIVMQLLTEQRRFGSAVGHTSFAILLAQDLAVVPILFVVTAFAATSGDPLLLSLGYALGGAVLAIVVILGVGRLLIRPLFGFVGQLQSPEAFLSMTLLVIAVTSIVTHLAGLSAALGAFLVGLLLAESEYRHEIEHYILPFKGMLLGLFFISVGMAINLEAIARNPFWTVAAIFGLIMIKATSIAVLTRWFGFSWATGVESGLLLGEGGEFAFVIIAAALASMILPPETAQFMLIVVTGTMIITPLVAWLAKRVGEHLQQPAAADLTSTPDNLAGFVVICGYGRIGQLLARISETQKTPHIALERNAAIVASYRKQGVAIYHADASRPGILSQLKIASASTFVITMDDFDAAERVLISARKVAPDLNIVMRARDPEHARTLRAVGANYVVPEVYESGLQMGQMLLQGVGFPPEVARSVIEEERSASMRDINSESGAGT